MSAEVYVLKSRLGPSYRELAADLELARATVQSLQAEVLSLNTANRAMAEMVLRLEDDLDAALTPSPDDDDAVA